jgi:hypothetical protein
MDDRTHLEKPPEGSGLDVVPVDDEEIAFRRAFRTAGHLEENGGPGQAIRSRAWSFAALNEMEERECAGRWLAGPDVAMVATLDNEAVPTTVSELLTNYPDPESERSIPLVVMELISAVPSSAQKAEERAYVQH